MQQPSIFNRFMLRIQVGRDAESLG